MVLPKLPATPEGTPAMAMAEAKHLENSETGDPIGDLVHQLGLSMLGRVDEDHAVRTPDSMEAHEARLRKLAHRGTQFEM